jgi:4-amino-4-deoxy-L-arabinose transferase-like glycosyltransferase
VPSESEGPFLPPAEVALGALLAIALGHLLVEVALNGFRGYGYFNDEFYYIACSKRLGLGYVDHPPFAPLLLRGVRAVLGESLPAIRLPAALAGAATVFLTGRMAGRLGGGRFAQALAALAVAVAPGLLVLFGFYSTNAFEILVWVASADLVLALGAGADPRWCLALGAVAGLGLENKHTTAVFVAALAIGILASPLRKRLREPWPWLGLLVALLVFLPNLAWEGRHDWISLEFYRAAEVVKNVPTSSLRAAFDQALFMNPVTLPLWLLGLRFYLLDRTGRPWRALGWTFAVLFALILVVPTSRPDRIAGAYPMLLAGGAVEFERWGRRAARVAAVAACAASVAVFAPLTLPLLPPAALATYARVLHLNPQVERQRYNAVPQWVADSLGWEDLADAVAAVYRELPPGDRQQAAVLTGDYAYAASLEFFGPARGVSRVISTHNQYFLWGPGDPPPRVVIALGCSRSDLDRLFADVEQAAIFRCDFCYQDGMQIWVARRPRVSLAAAWPSLKHFE